VSSSHTVGDVNIHLDISDYQNTSKWQSIMDSHGLTQTQHITTPTHNEGNILDDVVTRSDIIVADVNVDEPMISDHSFITVQIKLQVGKGQRAGAIRRRLWRRFDYDQFCGDLQQSVLLRNPAADVKNATTTH